MTVHIAQIPTRWDAVIRQRVPIIDVRQAERYGSLLVHHTGPASIEDAIQPIRDAIHEHYAPGDDYLMQAGEPILFAVALSAAMDVAYEDGADCVRVLRWDARHRVYRVVDVPPDA
jgi:hypothetical protein